MRGKPGPSGPGSLEGAGEGRKEWDPPPIPRPWALDGQAALWKLLARMGVKEPALAIMAPAEWEGRQRAGGVLRLPLPGSSSAPSRAEHSPLEKSGCLGPLPLLVP